ncbi:hypothetical protein JCM14036_11130 [Desulfotomaculum defluvii]
MSKIIFSSDDIKKLETNPYVAKVSERSITYTNDFKRLFIDQYLKGKLPRAIFTDAGFDIDIIGVKRYEQAAYRWIRSYNEDGILGRICSFRSRMPLYQSNVPEASQEIWFRPIYV